MWEFMSARDHVLAFSTQVKENIERSSVVIFELFRMELNGFERLKGNMLSSLSPRQMSIQTKDNRVTPSRWERTLMPKATELQRQKVQDSMT